MLEEAFSQNQKRAEELMNKGAAEVDPKVPEGFGVRVRLKKQEVEQKIDQKAKLWQQAKLQELEKKAQSASGQ